MQLFAELVLKLGTSTKTNDKLDALTDYFLSASDKDKVWVIAIFSGRRPRRAVSSGELWQYLIEQTEWPSWLIDESYHTVGDLAETIALLLPEEETQMQSHPLSYYLERLATLGREDEPVRKKFVLDAWSGMNKNEKFVFNKLITGGFRIGVSQTLMVNALARSVQLSPSVIAHRITGNWDPLSTAFQELMSEEAAQTDISKPYPFYLAYALEDEFAALGEPGEWQAEWKWDGIRGQMIKRDGRLFVWSRGEELMTDKFPEYEILTNILPDGNVLDGEIICISDTVSDTGGFLPLPFAVLQMRIGRKNITRKQLTEAPVGFIAYDLLEWNGEDCRESSLVTRRANLEAIVDMAGQKILKLSPQIHFDQWDELALMREKSRTVGSEGIMLKRKSSAYQVGRKKGDWWKWKIDPLVIDAVMVYAQKGHGKRSNLYTDYTFAVRDGEKLVTFAKAYSGLTDKEIAEVDYFVKRNSLEKFGPVRTVKPELVFEIAFEGIAASTRHKSGVALRFPRISRWRRDKKTEDANTLEDLKKMLEVYGK